MAKESKRAKTKMETAMHKFKEGALHAGSKKGPIVKKRKQAVAIAMHESRSKKGCR